MEKQILGLHHVTAIASDAQINYDFYKKVLGLRFVKKTVNFDDPSTYHFYFGNYQAEPGTILTFFPWGRHLHRGRHGTGETTEVSFSVPVGSLEFWQEHLKKNNVASSAIQERFQEKFISFQDPDGMNIELIEKANDNRQAHLVEGIGTDQAIKGFAQVTLTLDKQEATAAILTDIFGYSLLGNEGNRYRYSIDTVENAQIIDIVEAPGGEVHRQSAGSIHHIAFRVKDDATEMAIREHIVKAGLHVTEQIDRNYFHSLYFRTPGGVLFEIATDNPGFTVDESLESLGEALKLPAQYEPRRSAIEQILPQLH